MNNLTISQHGAIRIAQRGINNAELVALLGTEVEGGYLVSTQDYQNCERVLKRLLVELRRLVGKRVVIIDGTLVTAYHASKPEQRRLRRSIYDSDTGRGATSKRSW